MADRLFKTPLRALDAAGDGVSGAKVSLFETGTTTPVTGYTDAGGATAHPTPLVSDGGGTFAEIFVVGSAGVKVDVTDSAGTSLDGYPVDPVLPESSALTGAANVSFNPTTGVPDTDVQAAIETVDGKVVVLETARGISNNIYTTAGTTTAYTISVPNVAAYTLGDRYWVRANATNTAACTINVESNGGQSIKKYDSSGSIAVLAANDFVIGSEYLLHYDGTQFVIISERYSRAADSIWAAGTSTIQYGVTPANLAAAIGALSIFTKGFVSSEQTITSAGSLTVAHSLGAQPVMVLAQLKCLTAENGYSIGDIYEFGASLRMDASARGVSIVPDATNLNIRFGSDANAFGALNKGTGASVTLTNTNWSVIFRAFL